MKRALYEGDATTLNVYITILGRDLLGFAYRPKDYNRGRGFMDGVVIHTWSMPGAHVGQYSEGDTLVHETGHWLGLEHTFAGACGARGDFVDDTPKEQSPSWICEENRDTCRAPGFDPIHNFMDYSPDPCMNQFTPGQAARMSDSWLHWRATP
jgi:hypothetical protein